MSSEARPLRSTPPIPLSPRSHSFPLSFSPPLFLSIHTTESLLIICDLLKYIHCQSLSFPLSLTLPSLSLSLSFSLCPAFSSENLALLIPSLSTFSFFCLSVLQDNLSPPLHLLFVPQRSHKHCETWLAGALAWALAGREGWTLHFTAQTGPWAQ